MKTIYRITKLELNTLFYSPVAWLVLVIFIFQSSLTFMSALEGTQRMLEFTNAGSINGLTDTLFSNTRAGILMRIQSSLYLYMPLLTMGLMSRELSSGSIKLLLSSPIRIGEIILGKFFAIMLYGLLLILVVFSFAVAGYFMIDHMEFSTVTSGLLGFFLLVCAYGAIGLFMSCLTSYQVVAAISTLFVLALLRYVGDVGQDIDFVREITYYLSFSGRTTDLISGLLNSKDIAYFLIITILFLMFSILKLYYSTQSRIVLVKIGAYIGVTLAALSLIYATSRPGLILYKDTTSNQRRTISPASQKIIRQFKEDKPLKMTTYVNLLGNNFYLGSPQYRINDLQFIEDFRRFYPELETDYVYYYKDPTGLKGFSDLPGLPKQTSSELERAKKQARSYKVNLDMFISPDSIRKIINLKDEGYNLVRTLEYGGKREWLRMFNSSPPWPQEKVIASTLKRLLVQKIPRITFLSGNYERSPTRKTNRDYLGAFAEKSWPNSLINLGFDIDSANAVFKDIPVSTDVLVIADPRMPYSEAQLAKIRQYIAEGRDLLITAESGRQAIINPVLNMIGVEMKPGKLLQKSEFSYNEILAEPLPNTILGFAPSGAQDKTKIVAFMRQASALAIKDTLGFTYNVLLRTKEGSSWYRSSDYVGDSLDLQFNAAVGDVSEGQPVALALERTTNGRRQKIAVWGNGDIFSRNSPAAGKDYFFINHLLTGRLFRWYSDDEFPVVINEIPTQDKKINLGEKTFSKLRIFFVWILPVSLAIFGAVFLIRRKQK